MHSQYRNYIHKHKQIDNYYYLSVNKVIYFQTNTIPIYLLTEIVLIISEKYMNMYYTT